MSHKERKELVLCFVVVEERDVELPKAELDGFSDSVRDEIPKDWEEVVGDGATSISLDVAICRRELHEYVERSAVLYFMGKVPNV